MSLRSALASVLQRLRRERGMSQADFVGTVTQSHISLLEAGETSVSTDTLDAMCSSLGMHPVAFMTLVYSAYEQLTPAEVLEGAQANITELGLLEQRFEAAPEDHPHPRVSSAAKARRAVHELKKSGHSQAEIAGLLQMAESTVRRHWHRKDA